MANELFIQLACFCFKLKMQHNSSAIKTSKTKSPDPYVHCVVLFVTLRNANAAPESKKTKAAYSSEHTNNCLRVISEYYL